MQHRAMRGSRTAGFSALILAFLSTLFFAPRVAKADGPDDWILTGVLFYEELGPGNWYCTSGSAVGFWGDFIITTPCTLTVDWGDGSALEPLGTFYSDVDLSTLGLSHEYGLGDTGMDRYHIILWWNYGEVGAMDYSQDIDVYDP